MWPFKCKHQAATYGSQPVYGRLMYAGTDGLGTVHAWVCVRCGKCGKEFEAAMLHVPQGEWPKPRTR